MIIRDVLTIKGGEIYHVAPEASLMEAARLMIKYDIGSLVIRTDTSMVGLITERDLLRALTTHGCDIASVAVSEIMITEPIIGTPDDGLDYVRGVMTENRISHLPVMEGDTLLGIISFHDVAKACLNEANFENHLLKRYIKHWPEQVN